MLLMPVERAKEIKQRRKKKKRVQKLKAQLAAAKTVKEKERLIELIRRRQPYFTPEK